MTTTNRTAYVITQLGHWMVAANGGWTLKVSDARKFETREAAAAYAVRMDRRDLTIAAVEQGR